MEHILKHTLVLLEFALPLLISRVIEPIPEVANVSCASPNRWQLQNHFSMLPLVLVDLMISDELSVVLVFELL